MHVYWVTSQKPTTSPPTLFGNYENAQRDAKEQNEMCGEERFVVVDVEVF